MDTIGITINGKRLTCPSGVTVLEAAKTGGFFIPTLCHHPELKPYGACRLCLVEDEKTGRLYASCVTPVSDGLSVLTHSEHVISHRKTIISLIMAAHPESCLVCAKGNACDLRKAAADLGFTIQTLYPMPKYTPQDQSNPFIYKDITKCILCGKCIRGCRELVVNGTLEYSSRGFDSKPITALDTPLGQSSCMYCGTCVTLCPTGALMPSSSIFEGTPTRRNETVCGMCGVGCRLSLGVSGNRITDVRPSDAEGAPNGVTLCVRGHFGLDFLESPNRLTHPRIRKDGVPIDCSWEEAVSFTVERLKQIHDVYGPDSIGFYGSSKCTNEENYLFQKIARSVFKTRHIDNGGSVYGRNGMSLLDSLTSGLCRKNEFKKIEKSQVIVVIGTEPSETAPVLNYRIRRAAKNGSRLIVINPRKTDLARRADLWIKPDCSFDMVQGYADAAQGLCLSLYNRQGVDRQFVEWFTVNYPEYIAALKAADMDLISSHAFVDRTLIRRAAAMISGNKTSFVIGEDILEQESGVAAAAFANAAILAGVFGCENGGLMLVSRENNLTGAWDMGTVPDQLPGRIDTASSNGRSRIENTWNCRIPDGSGMGITSMISAIEEGKMKALFIMGENPVRTLPQGSRVREALEKLDVLIVQDILETETTKLGHIVLPGAAFPEKEGSFTNMEGRIQMFAQAVNPPGNAKSDFDILRDLACAMGMKTGNIGDIRREIELLVPEYRGMSRCSGSMWIQKTPEGIMEGKNDSHTEPSLQITFTLPEIKNSKTAECAFPYTAITGNSHFMAGSGTRSFESTGIRHHAGHEAIHISGDLATDLGLTGGSTVDVISAFGSVVRDIRIDRTLDRYMIVIPGAVCENDVMNLFDGRYQGECVQPGWRSCRVRIEKKGCVG